MARKKRSKSKPAPRRHSRIAPVKIEQVEITSLPKLKWALVGIPDQRWHEIEPAIKQLSAIEGVTCEVSTDTGAEKPTARVVADESKPLGYIIRNLRPTPVDGVLGLVGMSIEDVSIADLCESVQDAHAIARADGFRDGEYRVEPVYDTAPEPSDFIGAPNQFERFAMEVIRIMQSHKKLEASEFDQLADKALELTRKVNQRLLHEQSRVDDITLCVQVMAQFKK